MFNIHGSYSTPQHPNLHTSMKQKIKSNSKIKSTKAILGLKELPESHKQY
jgi:hypothetical protein